MSAALNLNNPVKKDDSIQILRGLAIIAVVIIHSCPHNIIGVFLRPLVNFAVAMFIFLSGYLTKLEISDKKAFIFKRLKKVFIPYCVWSVIYMIPSGFDGFFVKFITGRCCTIYYYIFVYMQFVVLTPLIIKLIKSKYRALGWFITPVFTILFGYVFVWLGLDTLNSNFNYLFVAWFIYYYLGLFLGNNVKTLRQNNFKNVSLYIITIALSICEGLVWYSYGNYNMAATQLRLTSIGTSVMCVILAYHFIRSQKNRASNIISKPLVAIGNASFGIYLSHMLIKSVLSILPIWKFLVFPLNTVVILVLSFVCVILGKKILSKFSWILGL